MKIIIHWIISAAVIFLAAQVIPGTAVSGVGAAFLAALLLAVVNILIRPIIYVLTLPITIVTLGLFSLIIDAAMVLLVSHFVTGFYVEGFLPALYFAILLTIVNWIFHIGKKK